MSLIIGKILIVLFFVCGFIKSNYAQYYTKAQIQLINSNKTAYEGDMYLDTINEEYYIGLTNGILARIGDTSSLLIDSVKLINDSIVIYQDTNVFKVQASSAERRNNYKLVKSIADLADELVAGGGTKYLLTTNYLYEINGTILVDFPIELNNAFVTGEDGLEDVLFNASGTTLFSGTTGGNLKRLIVMGNGQQVFNITGTGTDNLVTNAVNYAGASSLGTLSNLNIVFFNIGQFVNNTTGLTVTDVTSLFMTLFTWTESNTGTFLTLTGAFDEVQLSNARINTAVGEIGIDVSTNPTINGYASISQVTLVGLGTSVSGYTVGTYTGYDFSNEWYVQCQGILQETDEVATGNLYVSTAAVTPILLVNTPIKASGVTTGLNLFRASSLINNRLTYIGNKTRFFTYTASISVTASANGRRFVFYIAKNGVVLPESAQSRKIANGADRGSISLSGVTQLQTNDYIEVWVENINDNTDITLESMNLLIK